MEELVSLQHVVEEQLEKVTVNWPWLTNKLSLFSCTPVCRPSLSFTTLLPPFSVLAHHRIFPLPLGESFSYIIHGLGGEYGGRKAYVTCRELCRQKVDTQTAVVDEGSFLHLPTLSITMLPMWELSILELTKWELTKLEAETFTGYVSTAHCWMQY